MWAKAPAAFTDALRSAIHSLYRPIMRPETERTIAEIKQAIALLRRHL